MKPRAIAYLRVSTVEQKSGFGMSAQEKSAREHAKNHGLRIVEVIADEAISGSKGEDLRPGLARALVRLQDEDADVLLVPRLDRLARDLVLQETIIRKLAEMGKRVESAAEPDVMAGDGPRTLIRQILGAVAQYEATLIAARLRAGREIKRARGGYASGRPPYGFRASSGDLVRDEAEQQVIIKARRLRKRGKSLRAIADQLEADGHRTRSGGSWYPTQVARLVGSL